MVAIEPRVIFQGLLALAFLNHHVAVGQQAYPNPFAKPAPPVAQQPAQPVAQQPAQLPGQQGSGGQAGSGAYPNPFLPQPGGSTGGQAGSGAYPNPFLPQTGGPVGGIGGQQPIGNPPTSGGGTPGSGGASICAAKPASLDPNNVGGTCCCDPKKSFVASTTPQPQGGCCPAGNKWGSSCLDGGSFTNNPLTCPALHRNTRITPSGPQFELFCHVRTQRQDLKIDDQDSFIECVDACGATPGCVGVDYYKVTGKCHYKSEYMDANTVGVVDNDVDSASRPPPPIIECPQARGQIQSIGGVDYEIFCDSYLTGTRHTKQFKNAQECAAECSSLGSACNAFDYQNKSNLCWIQPEYERPPSGKGGDWVTWVPTKKK